MGFFRKLFGGGDDAEPAPSTETPKPSTATPTVPAATNDPYRGPAYVATDLDHEEVVQVGAADPIFTYEGRVLALEVNRRGPLPLRAMVYTGLSRDRPVLRRVTFGEKGYRIDWEHRPPFDRAIRFLLRVEDRVLLPLRNGLMAVHLETGKPCWELPHPSPLAKEPRMDRDGNVLLVFDDQSWMVVAPRDGATVREGVARNERDVEQVSRGFAEIGEKYRSPARYGDVTVELTGSGLRVRGESETTVGPPSPTLGNYPIDSEWEPSEWVVLVGQKLHVGLTRRWGNKHWAAVGILDPTSLEPLQLLELGEVTTNLSCWVVDDMLVVDTDVPGRPDDTFFIIDPVAERVIAMLREDEADGYMFDRDGARIWAKPL